MINTVEQTVRIRFLIYADNIDNEKLKDDFENYISKNNFDNIDKDAFFASVEFGKVLIQYNEDRDITYEVNRESDDYTDNYIVIKDIREDDILAGVDIEEIIENFINDTYEDKDGSIKIEDDNSYWDNKNDLEDKIYEYAKDYYHSYDYDREDY